MKILITDHIHKAGIELLQQSEIGEVEVATELSKDELLEKVKEADALIVRSKTKVTREIIEAGKKLKVIGRAGVGVDNIDLESATKRGIVVVNAPEATSITVAEHTLGLMLALARKIPQANASLKSGKWEKKKFLGVELRGKTLGVIGLGRIGTQVVKKAKAFEMKILAYDPYISKEKAEELGVKITSLEELLKNSDFITLHVPLTKQTKGMISKKELQLMKDGAYLINCARGGVIDERALYEALAIKKLAGAALDVFEKEPPVGNPLLNLDNVVVTPHLGASTEEAQRLASMIVCEEVLKVLRNEPPRNVVNMPAIPQEVLDKLRIYFPLAENMGKFAIQIVEGRIKETSITYCGKLKEIEELNVLTNIILCGILKPILTEGVNILNASLIAKNRGIKITEGKREEAEKFESLIILKMKTDKEELEIKGTLVGKDPIIVGIEDYEVSLYPAGKILIVLHEDKPGMIGKVALTLGKRNVNIASMQVGRKRKGEPQLMVMYVDHRITPQIERDISNIDGVHKVRSLEL